VIHFRIRYERLRGRLGAVRRRAAVVRAAWLGLLVPLAGMVAHIAGVVPLAPAIWATGAALVFAGVSLGWARPDPPAALDRALDRRFGLEELLVTAVEVDQRGPRTSIESRLLDDAATAVAVLGGERAIDGRATRREAETLVALALMLAGLWLLAGTLGGQPPLARLPELGALDGGGAGGSGANGGGPGSLGGDPSTAMGLLAGALGDHAAARDIADALAAGDPTAAARAARMLADRATGLSPAGRSDLAETLEQLAGQMHPIEPGLSDALKQAAGALNDPTVESSVTGIEQLAQAFEALTVGGSPAGREPQPTARSRAGPAAERLAVRPTPLALGAAAARGRRFTSGPALGDAAAADPSRVEYRADPVRGGRAAGTPVAVGADPLRYPWELRDMVRQYFAPAGREP